MVMRKLQIEVAALATYGVWFLRHSLGNFIVSPIDWLISVKQQYWYRAWSLTLREDTSSAMVLGSNCTVTNELIARISKVFWTLVWSIPDGRGWTNCTLCSAMETSQAYIILLLTQEPMLISESVLLRWTFMEQYQTKIAPLFRYLRLPQQYLGQEFWTFAYPTGLKSINW